MICGCHHLGDTSVTVPAGQASIYSSPKMAEPTNMAISYTFYHPEEKMEAVDRLDRCDQAHPSRNIDIQ
jgi:hypothetical protein